MQRLPKQLLCVEAAPTPAEYESKPNEITTVSACTVTNKTVNARWVTISVTPPAGVARNVCFQEVIPAGRSINIAGAIGQSFAAAGKLSVVGEVTGALDVVISGYVSNP